MDNFILFDDEILEPVVEDPEDLAVSESESGASSGTDSDTDYNKLIYEYLSSQDVLTATRQEEMYAAQTALYEELKTQLQEVHDVLEWNMSLLLLLVVLFLFRSVRRWVYKLTGGLNDVC